MKCSFGISNFPEEISSLKEFRLKVNIMFYQGYTCDIDPIVIFEHLLTEKLLVLLIF